MRALSKLRLKIADRFGLVVQQSQKSKLDPVVRDAAAARREPMDDVVDRALLDSTLLRDIAGSLTVGESYFFRHSDQLDAIVRFVRERLKQDPGRRVRIWSAGCAAGQEPYSVAMLLREKLTQHQRQQVTLLATDIDGDAVADAVAGRFSQWAMRATSASRRERFFLAEPDGTFLLDAEVRDSVSFELLSLQEHLQRIEPGSLDCILFRNVAIYLNERALTDLYRGFARVLVDDGLLLVSATDPRPGGTAFRLCAADSTTVYERVRYARPETSMPAPRYEPREAPATPPPLPTTPPGTAPSDSAEASPPELWDSAKRLADRGEYVRALSLCSEALQILPNDKDGYMLRAIIGMSAGAPERAVDDLRRVLFLDHEDGNARYWYALALNAIQRPSEARQQVCQLVETLQQRGDSCRAGQDELLQAALSLRESLG